MSDDYNDPGTETAQLPTASNTSLPVILLSLAVATFLGAQVRSTSQLDDTMTWQLEVLAKQKETLAAAKKSYGDLLLKRETTVGQAAALEKDWVDLFNDVLALAREDQDAATVIAKYRIKRGDEGTESGATAGEKKADETKPGQKK